MEWIFNCHKNVKREEVFGVLKWVIGTFVSKRPDVGFNSVMMYNFIYLGFIFTNIIFTDTVKILYDIRSS